jgi:hypothetical protein
MKKNDRVKVDFTSESSTEFSGKRFTGEGVIDRIEDGRVFGRLDDSTPFMCDLSDAIVIEQQDKRKEYEAFFMKQPFYLQLKYIHGDRLFDFDVGIGCRNLTVQIGYVCWCKDDKEFVI